MSTSRAFDVSLMLLLVMPVLLLLRAEFTRAVELPGEVLHEKLLSRVEQKQQLHALLAMADAAHKEAKGVSPPFFHKPLALSQGSMPGVHRLVYVENEVVEGFIEYAELTNLMDIDVFYSPTPAGTIQPFDRPNQTLFTLARDAYANAAKLEEERAKAILHHLAATLYERKRDAAIEYLREYPKATGEEKDVGIGFFKLLNEESHPHPRNMFVLNEHAIEGIEAVADQLGKEHHSWMPLHFTGSETVHVVLYPHAAN